MIIISNGEISNNNLKHFIKIVFCQLRLKFTRFMTSYQDQLFPNRNKLLQHLIALLMTDDNNWELSLGFLQYQMFAADHVQLNS